MKTQIPDALKSDLPPSTWGKILSATPVIMTVIATMLAGLASSEMTRAQYSRSLAAQQQSKAGDQWNFFQAKRLRGSMQQSTLDLLQSTTTIRTLDATTLRNAGSAPLSSILDSPTGQQTLIALFQGQLPAITTGPAPDPKVQSALEAIDSSKSEAEIAPFIAALDDRVLTEALRASKDRATALDVALTPLNKVVAQIEQSISGIPRGATGDGGGSLGRDFTAARLRYAVLRYDSEARLNQAVANLYELQVRRANMTAERHHRRSQRFFYGMLGAQAAVIVSTFSLAARKRNMLWTLAAAAGLAAIAFAIYVYFYV